MDYVYNNGELYHARNYSHKYLKREWKNGHWVYWYPTDVETRDRHEYNAYAREGNKTPTSIKNHKVGLATSGEYDLSKSYYITKPIGGGRNTVISKFRTADDYRKANKAGSIYREGLKENQRDYKNKLASESKKRNAANVNLAAHSDPKKYVEDYIAKAKHAGLFPGPKVQPKVEKGKKWFQNIFSTNYTIKDIKTGRTIASGTKPGWGLFKKKDNKPHRADDVITVRKR